MAATASQTNLAGLPRRLVQDGIAGLPRRLVQDGIVSEAKLAEASEAAKKDKVPLVAYLVNEDIANARAIAVAASHEFGVPLLDLDALELDIDCIRAVDQKLINKHRVLQSAGDR
jgi:type IV pilus assembly protein PilB